MTQADSYRVKAAEFRAKATHQTDPTKRAELLRLAKLYLRLAEQADRNAELDVAYLPPLDRSRQQGPQH